MKELIKLVVSSIAILKNPTDLWILTDFAFTPMMKTLTKACVLCILTLILIYLMNEKLQNPWETVYFLGILCQIRVPEPDFEKFFKKSFKKSFNSLQLNGHFEIN